MLITVTRRKRQLDGYYHFTTIAINTPALPPLPCPQGWATALGAVREATRGHLPGGSTGPARPEASPANSMAIRIS